MQETAKFLTGQPLNPVSQGEAKAYNALEELLRGPPEKIKEAFEQAAKELSSYEQRRTVRI